jgi:DNA primase
LIPKHIIDQIFETARIEDVIGDFVNLKKSGSSLKGLSPFADEKTPSFMVSPVKQIFKDFSSGKGGNVVTFLMEHEHYSYPEALKVLAKRYNIEIPEDEEMSPEQKEAQSERESLYVINNYAQTYFSEQLWDTDEGKSVALGYFKERGFTDKTIKKFNLGYNPEGWENLVKAAKENGYKTEYLVKVGLAKQKDERVYDTYRGRVMFPIHNLSGRVIGFGGRTLRTDKNIPKYINSPESIIYNKSQTLYGIYQSKSEIIKQDNCLLVEGYTDVISLHQNGIENVVASSGTSLTEDQIRLIKRYTNNVTVLYDGDAAGIKASFRGIDMLLTQGLNIKVVSFPGGEDPDSFAQKHETEETKEFLASQAKDFIVFKTDILSKDGQNDPLQKAKLLRDVVNSIALIPDHLTRAVYIKECSKLLDVEERTLVLELNKIRRKNDQDKRQKDERNQGEVYRDAPLEDLQITKVSVHVNENDLNAQESEVIRVLLTYCNIGVEKEPEFDKQGNPIIDPDEEILNAGTIIIAELLEDGFAFENTTFQNIFETVKSQLETEGQMDENYFLVHAPEDVRNVYIDCLKPGNELHKWDTKKIFVKTEKEKIRLAIESALLHLRSKRLMKLIGALEQKIKLGHQNNEDIMPLMQEKKKLDEVKKMLSKPLGIVIR